MVQVSPTFRTNGQRWNELREKVDEERESSIHQRGIHGNAVL
jgi:hypothetical protein